jgi:hypothetical protein
MTDIGDRLEQLASTPMRSSAQSLFERATSTARQLRRRRVQRRFVSVGAVAAAVVASVMFAAQALPDNGGLKVVTRGSSTTQEPGAIRYETDAAVEQGTSGPPELCIDPVLSAAPGYLPARPTPPGLPCEGPPIRGWDWSRVTEVNAQDGVRWGTYHVVGTYDGKTFTLTQQPEPAPASSPPQPTVPDTTTPCPTPPGGWTIRDRSRFTLDDFQAVEAAAQGAADYVGEWSDGTTPVDGAVRLSPEAVRMFAFTGDAATHQAQLEAIWGGPICVVQRPYSLDELRAAITAIDGSFGTQLGIDVFEIGPDAVGDRVDVTTTVATPAMQAAVEQRFGAGLVNLMPLLTIVP